MTADLLAAAIEYTTMRKWVIHPLSAPGDKRDSPGKKPLLKNWQNLERTPNNIKSYIKKGCNIGLVCGKSSGITIIDVDSELFVEDLFCGFELDTLKSKRIEGRGHIYFKHSPDLPTSRHHDLGIEILSDGGNAVLPPSTHVSGDIYHWNNPDAPIIEMPKELEKRILKLFQTEAELKRIIAKCRHCFRDVIERRPDMHGAEGREMMLVVCTDLKASGAEEQHIKMFAKLMYPETYLHPDPTKEPAELRTLREWRNIDPTKTWTCETLKAKLPAYIDLDQCAKCDVRRERAGAASRKNRLDKAIGFFKDKIHLAEEMQAHIPIYYDKSRNYWLWNAELGYYMRIDETDVLNCIRHNSSENVLNAAERNEILTAIQLTGRERDVKEIPDTWIQFRNCVIDYKTGERFNATPEYFFTSPIPHYIGDSTNTPTIDKLFKDWMGAEAYKLDELAAYTLSNGYIIHRLFFLVGKGRNGKGQFMEFLERFAGSENTTTVELEKLVESRFEASKLYTKRVGFVGETNFGVLKNTAALKKLTGDDKIGGEFKHKDPFDFWNAAKLIIAANSLPTTLDKTDAFYARCIVYEFKNQFPLSKKIVDSIPDSEYENFALKCIELLPKLLDQGIFTNEGTIEEKAKNYERISNPVEQYLNLYYKKDVNGVVALWQVFEGFTLFCAENGHRKITKNELKKIIENLYEVEKKNIGGQCWVWIYGISEKKDLSNSVTDLSVLSKLSTFPHNPIYEKSSGNTDKMDKTDKSVTELSQLEKIKLVKNLIFSHYGYHPPSPEGKQQETENVQSMFKDKGIALSEDEVLRFVDAALKDIEAGR